MSPTRIAAPWYSGSSDSISLKSSSSGTKSMFRRISVLGDGFPVEIVSQTSKPSTGTEDLSSLPPVMDKNEIFQERLKDFMILWEGEGNSNLTNSYPRWRFHKMFCLTILYVGLLFGSSRIYLEMGRNLGWVASCNCFTPAVRVLLETKQETRSHIVSCNYPTSDCGRDLSQIPSRL